MSYQLPFRGASAEFETFTVYFNPSDYPGLYVVRRAAVTKDGIATDPEPLVISHFLKDARRPLLERGLFRSPRQHHDDPVIVEVWF